MNRKNLGECLGFLYEIINYLFTIAKINYIKNSIEV